MTRERLRQLRAMIVKAAESLSDGDAFGAPELFQKWEPDKDYTKGARARDEEELYSLIPETHHSQADWPPHLVPAIWKRIDDPAIEWPEWVRPTGAHDSYAKGAKVSRNGKHWISDIEGNPYEPGVAGWTEAE
ncbi:MAG: alpha-amylase [Oscillospiraceae bacterium]|nr:alpha-amylase [Oscillospiraceae bacterium]